VAPRGGARGHADEGIGGARRRGGGGGGDGEVDPPQLVRAGYGNLSANYPPGSGGGHGCLAVVGVGYAGGRHGKEGFREWVLGGETECGRRLAAEAKGFENRQPKCRVGPPLEVFFFVCGLFLFFSFFWGGGVGGVFANLCCLHVHMKLVYLNDKFCHAIQKKRVDTDMSAEQFSLGMNLTWHV